LQNDAQNSEKKGSADMIRLFRLNGVMIVVNADMIETVESTPDTVITLTNGKKYVVANDLEDVMDQVVEYKQGKTRGGVLPPGDGANAAR
jgi:flagellar protein FlbD